jgi:pimeloyl-ACP methyl ester carboxylesterase
VTEVAIDRAFLRVQAGLIHYRHAAPTVEAGTIPLVMAHGGPGSSAGLAPMIAALGTDRRVVAPDMMGNGDSDPPPNPPTIAFYAECLVAVMDHLGLEQVDLYGHHTGAQVVCEAAIAHPARVRRLVLDGLGLFPPDLRAEFMTRYAPEIKPDANGGHLLWLWDFIGQTSQHFPHYLRDEAHRVAGGAAPPLDAWTTRSAEVLKVWSTYHLAYRAAFSHDLASRLALVISPTVILAVANDPLESYAGIGADLIPGARVQCTTREKRADALRAILTD